jgi:hypothetical protein
MRGIRQLQPELAATAPVRKPAAWNPTKGTLFVVGIVLLLSGVIAATYNYRPYSQYSQVARYQPSEQDLAHEFADIDRISAEELWDAWHQQITKTGLGDHDRSPFVIARARARHYQTNMIGALSAIAAGLVLSLASLVLR